MTDVNRLSKKLWQSLKQTVNCSNECCGCGNSTDAVLCQVCSEQVRRFQCSDFENILLNNRPGIKHAVPKLVTYKMNIIGPHQGLLKSCISSFKYKNTTSFATTLGEMLWISANYNYQNDDFPQAIIPVPIHPAKQFHRGFNQTVLLGQEIQTLSAIPLQASVLHSKDNKGAQVTKGGKQRRHKSSESFYCSNGQEIKELRHIAILDDVITTGTTILAALKTLQKVNPQMRIDLWSLSISLQR